MLNLDNIIDFPPEKVKALQKIIQERRDALTIVNLYINEIPREDIFNILDHYCTVVYFPLPEGESNDGFHITMPVDYQVEYNDRGEEHFVFLNTAKPREKQVFAAAHELGHIWVEEDSFWDDALEKVLPHSTANVDAVMNRFAAELLMPAEIFRSSADSLFERFVSDDGLISSINAFRTIASLMDEFCVPAQAVICRFYETGMLKKEICQELLTGPTNVELPKAYPDYFKELLSACVGEGGYANLLTSSPKWGMRDFPEVLDEMEQKGLFSEQTIKQLRETLRIPKIEGEGKTPIAPINIRETE